MRYFLDTEFYERSPSYPITLISLGIVAEDDREFYVENDDTTEVDWNEWLLKNVAPHLNGPRLAYWSIGPAVQKFIGSDPNPEFWAYYGAYDWVVFCQLFGTMMDMPKTYPHFCLDLKQELYRRGINKPFIKRSDFAHHALADARWNKKLYEQLFLKPQGD